MSDNTKFAHRSKESNIENFYKIISGEKKENVKSKKIKRVNKK